MSTETSTSDRRAHLAKLVLDLGEERALEWLEETLWLEDEDLYGGDGLPALVADELNLLGDEQVEEWIAKLEG
jgi:hypothetical protein